MQKLEKNIKLRKHFNNKYFSKQFKRHKIFFRFRKLYKASNFSFNIYFKRLLQFFKKKQTIKKLYIRLTSNNVFCTLVQENKTLLLGSTSKYKIKTSKKLLKFSSKIILRSFLKEIKNKNKILNETVLIKIISPKNLRKKIINQLSQSLTSKNIIFETIPLKVFNGCRAKKQRRKKRKGFRLFK